MNKRNPPKSKKPSSDSATSRGSIASSRWVRIAIAVTALAVLGLVIWFTQHQSTSVLPSLAGGSGVPTPSSPPTEASSVPLPTNQVAQAVMVTVELDFPDRLPSIKEALQHIERRYEPEDGRGRTFAILDAYGEPTPAGKLHISMHVSMEKPGLASLVFRRTGEVLWKSRIVPGPNGPPGEKSLTILMDDGHGKTLQMDGARGASNILKVPFRDSTAVAGDIWLDGEVREFTYIYSACGCPVKAKVQRIGETTVRSTELPVMFPDDPAAMSVIRSLMGWTDGS